MRLFLFVLLTQTILYVCLAEIVTLTFGPEQIDYGHRNLHLEKVTCTTDLTVAHVSIDCTSEPERFGDTIKYSLDCQGSKDMSNCRLKVTSFPWLSILSVFSVAAVIALLFQGYQAYHSKPTSKLC